MRTHALLTHYNLFELQNIYHYLFGLEERKYTANVAANIGFIKPQTHSGYGYLIKILGIAPPAL